MWEVGYEWPSMSVSLYHEAGEEADNEAYYHCLMTNWMSDSITTAYVMNNLPIQSHAWGLSHSLWQRVEHYTASLSILRRIPAYLLTSSMKHVGCNV